MKHFIVLLYSLLMVVLAVATVLEYKCNTAFATTHVYHTWWFCALWALLAVLTVVALVKRRVWKQLSLLLLHSSFIVILLGAAITFLTSQKGYVHLVPGTEVKAFQSEDNASTWHALPFTLSLDSFEVKHYAGTSTPMDYVSHLTVAGKEKATVAMNRIYTRQGYRFYQSSYDEDGTGSWLSVNYDPWGTGITYVGYLLLAVSMLWVLASRGGEFRRLLRHPLLRKGGLLGLLLLFTPTVQARHSLPAFNREKADSLAAKQVIYNGRVAPFNTLARDFVLKLTGKASYGGLTPEQVVSGWLLRPDAWQHEPMILIKNKELRQLLHIDGKYARLTDLFQGSDYVLQRYWKGTDGPGQANDALQKAIAETDEKVGLLMMLNKGTLIEPLPSNGSVQPLSATRVQAELLYNRLPLTEVLFMLNLTLGFVAFGLMIYRQMRDEQAFHVVEHLLGVGLWLSTAALAFTYTLRWYVAGHVPMSNGFETMQFMALCTLMLACALQHRFKVMMPFGFILSGFALLVSHLGQSNPQITNLMPVLSSPWLSVHVSVVMMGYSLLAFTMLCGVMGLCVPRKAEVLMLLSRLLLYPAVFFLGIGIFLGAVWANQSWGTYWSWDPKETWALITFMIYALGFHTQALPWLRSPRCFHAFTVGCFLAVLMTYFGVNFLLGGMHSYAG